MAKLTSDQQTSVAQWVADGATLNDIQDRLKRELGMTLTYMDTRLLIMELGLKLIDKPKEVLPQPESKPPEQERLPEEQASYDEGDLPPEDAPAYEAEDALPMQGGDVSVSLDALAIPGTMVSGKATFSDGKTASWHIDQYGRLGLRPPEPGYQPPPADIPIFQRELQRLLQQQGY